MEEQKKKRPFKRLHYRVEGVTNFYPMYTDGERDRVTRVLPVYPTGMQEIIPRYELSMTETRDSGTGPVFLETEYPTPEQRRQKMQEPSKKQVPPKENPKFQLPKHKRKKIRTDFWS